jgi:hypothetical protein
MGKYRGRFQSKIVDPVNKNKSNKPRYARAFLFYID